MSSPMRDPHGDLYSFRPEQTGNDASHEQGEGLNLLSIVGIRPAAASMRMVPGITSEHTINVGGDQRSYAVHLPKNWDGKSPLPVMYYFNGMQPPGGKQEPESFTGLSDRADKMGFAVVYMRGSNKSNQTYNNGQKIFANSADENAYLNAVHQTLGQQLPLDDKRQGLAGFSQGGSEAYVLAATNKWVASVQSVEGYMTGYEQPLNHPVSEQNIHDLRDPLVPENGTEQEGSQAEQETQAGVNSLLGGLYYDVKGLFHAALYEYEKNGNYIEPQRYIVDAYKNAAGITGDGQTVKTPDMTTYDYQNPTTRAEVRQITLNEGTHGWAGSTDHSGDIPIVGQPNEKLSASDELSNFFLEHPLIQAQS